MQYIVVYVCEREEEHERTNKQVWYMVKCKIWNCAKRINTHILVHVVLLQEIHMQIAISDGNLVEHVPNDLIVPKIKVSK